MKIIGNGVDIVDNFRIKKAIKNKKFINRLFTNEEIKSSLKKNINRPNYFAKRFAAKEAFVKAIGTGFSKNINFKDINIKNNPYGKPEIYVNTKLMKIIKKKFKISKFKSYLSLTDEKNHSISFVIISGS
jgi:holo-[acyl-carrier-protein] synthase